MIASVWQWIGFTGTALFGARWVIQALGWRRGRRASHPRPLWVISLASSVALVAYFAVGPQRSAVGALGTLFPLMVAAWDLARATRRRPVILLRKISVRPAPPRVTDRRWPVPTSG